MTKPRPPNMFQHPQESALAPMRDKLLFTEAMMASDELTGREMRVAFLLTSLWSSTRGNAYPAMQWIADALRMDKRDVAKLLHALEAKGWFLIQRGSCGRGKEHANRYVPNVEKVASAAAFNTVAVQTAQQRAAEKRWHFLPEKVAKFPEKVAPVPLDPGTSYLTGVLRTNTADLRSASRPQDDDAMADPKAVMAKLQIIQRSINARPLGTWTEAEAPGLTDWLAFCDEVAEVYDSHTGDPFGGLAHRLSAILAYELHNLAPTRREMTPAEFEARRQQILRDLEGPPPTPPKTSGPAFGKWVFAESQRRKIPAEYIADALGITVGQLGYMTAGKVQWAAPQRKRVVEALTRYHLNGPVP